MSKQTIIPPTAAINGPITYGGFMDRFIALLIDFVMLYIIQLAVLAPLFGFLMPFVGIAPTSFFVITFIGSGVVAPSNMLLGWLYFAWFESSKHGATLGKRAMNLRVVDEDGLQVSFGSASLRFFFKYVSMLPLMIGFIMAIFTRKHQALHDLVAQTMVLVVDRNDEVA